MDRVGPAATILGLALATTMAGPRDPGVTAKPSGRTLGGALAEAQLVNLSRPEAGSAVQGSTAEETQLTEAAAQGNIWAQARLGIVYVNSHQDPIRLQLGLELLNQAASAGSADAFLELAKMALAGRGIDRSPSVAFGHMKKAAELGLSDAEYELASMYSEGRGTSKDPVAAWEWARKAAAKSHPKASVVVGAIMLQSPDSTARAEGRRILAQAAETGNKEAVMFLATAYAKGESGLPRNEVAAEGLIKKYAEEGEPEFQFVLASLYNFGESFASQRDEARVWLQRAADQGHLKALEILSLENR